MAAIAPETQAGIVTDMAVTSPGREPAAGVFMISRHGGGA
jgi:hypothetical protein